MPNTKHKPDCAKIILKRPGDTFGYACTCGADKPTPPAPEDCECNEGYGPCGECASCRPDLYPTPPAPTDKRRNTMTMTAEQSIEFEKVMRPVIEWLNNNMHPHAHIFVNSTCAELVEV